MIEDIRAIKGDPGEWRKFGLAMGIVFGLVGGYMLWKGRGYHSYLFALAAVFAAAGLFLPALLKPLYKGWMTLAAVLGWLMTRVILCVLFYIVLTPVGLLARAFGKRFMNLSFRESAETDWIQKRHGETVDYERQY